MTSTDFYNICGLVKEAAANTNYYEKIAVDLDADRQYGPITTRRNIFLTGLAAALPMAYLGNRAGLKLSSKINNSLSGITKHLADPNKVSSFLERHGSSIGSAMGASLGFGIGKNIGRWRENWKNYRYAIPNNFYGALQAIGTDNPDIWANEAASKYENL